MFEDYKKHHYTQDMSIPDEIDLEDDASENDAQSDVYENGDVQDESTYPQDEDIVDQDVPTEAYDEPQPLVEPAPPQQPMPHAANNEWGAPPPPVPAPRNTHHGFSKGRFDKT